MGNQQSVLNGLTDGIQTPIPTKSKLNYGQVTKCNRKKFQLQQIIEKQDPFADHFNEIEDIKYKKYQNGDIYIGSLDQYGKPSGYGKLLHQNGSIQIGAFKSGKLNGKGRSYLNNESIFQGHFENGQIIGQGTYKKGQYSYIGQFQGGTFSGKGVEQDGLHKYSFSGFFENGRRKRGKLTWSNNLSEQFSYQGQFNAQNQFDGYGQMKNTKGQYKGQFRNGQKHGVGVFKFANGVLYVGDYKNGIRQGHGTVYNAPKNDIQQQSIQNISYRGTLVQDLPQGIGCVYNQQMKELKIALYEKGIAIRQATEQQKKFYNSNTFYNSQNAIINQRQQQRQGKHTQGT